MLEPPVKLELAGLIGLVQQGEKLASVEPAQHPDREEEPWAAGHPARPVQSHAAGRHDAVHMGMMEERLSPRVEDGEEADAGSQVPRRRRNLQQRLTHGPEQQAVDLLGILQCEWSHHIRHREHHVGVRHGQQVLLLCVEPLRCGTALTLRAVTVAARVVGNPFMPAFIADLDMPTEHRRAASDERLDHFRPGQGERGQPPLPNEGAQQVGHLECRPRHSDRQAADLQAIEGTRCAVQPLCGDMGVDGV